MNVPYPVIVAQIDGLKRLVDAQAVQSSYALSECNRLAGYSLAEAEAAKLGAIRRLVLVWGGIS